MKLIVFTRHKYHEEIALIRFFNGLILFPLLERAAKRDIFTKLNELKKFQKLSLAEQNQIQKNELHKMVVFCKNNVPYYRDLFQKINFDESKVLSDIKYIQDVPILTKQIIREQCELIKQHNAYHVRKTGGSTGQSVFFYYDNNGLDWTSAINLLAYELAENFTYRNDCHISSELNLEKPAFKYQMLDWLKLFSQNRQRLMIRSFSDEDLEQSFQSLVKIKPYLMQGHPSSAYAIANYIKKMNLKKKKYCSVFEPSGEALNAKMVDCIQEYLGCKVVNRYGNAEFGVMAHTRPQDPWTKLLVFNRAFYAEETNNSNLIISNFTNYGMPLLRYDTGDIGTVKNESDGTFIYDLQGRIHDIVKIDQEDYATHYIMDYLDHKIRQVREFQIILKGNDRVILNIVAEHEADQPRIKSEILLRWPKGLEVQFIKYEELIKVGWQQKFRHIIDQRTAL